MERITIIGLGLIGTSIGLALKRAGVDGFEIMGTDMDSRTSSKAARRGAVDRTARNLRSAVEGAKLVILATPVAAMREIMENLGPHLEEGCTLTDTGSTKGSILAWADQYLPSKVSFVGGHPMAGKETSGPEAAEASLFDGATYCVIPARRARREAVKTVIGLAETLGAKPFFMDAAEHDSFVAAVSHLPMILSTALVACTSKSPSWSEMSILTSTGFRDVSRLASGDPEMNRDICLTNPDAVVHWIDEVIKELYGFRNRIKEGGEEIYETFIKAWEARARWQAGAVQERQGIELPSASESMAGILVGDKLAKRARDLTETGKRDPLKYFRRRQNPK